jgi:hypothetical protein
MSNKSKSSGNICELQNHLLNLVVINAVKKEVLMIFFFKMVGDFCVSAGSTQHWDQMV